jgi:hypothetical protein
MRSDSREDATMTQSAAMPGGEDMSSRHAPLSLATHARIDAAVLTCVLVSPWLFGFSAHRGATIMAVACFVAGLAVLANTLLTRPIPG